MKLVINFYHRQWVGQLFKEAFGRNWHFLGRKHAYLPNISVTLKSCRKPVMQKQQHLKHRFFWITNQWANVGICPSFHPHAANGCSTKSMNKYLFCKRRRIVLVHLSKAARNIRVDLSVSWFVHKKRKKSHNACNKLIKWLPPAPAPFCLQREEKKPSKDGSCWRPLMCLICAHFPDLVHPQLPILFSCIALHPVHKTWIYMTFNQRLCTYFYNGFSHILSMY